MAKILSVYIPFKVTPEDAIMLNTVAQDRQATHSEVLRQLIRSLNASTRIATKVETPVS